MESGLGPPRSGGSHGPVPRRNSFRKLDRGSRTRKRSPPPGVEALVPEPRRNSVLSGKTSSSTKPRRKPFISGGSSGRRPRRGMRASGEKARAGCDPFSRGKDSPQIHLRENDPGNRWKADQTHPRTAPVEGESYVRPGDNRGTGFRPDQASPPSGRTSASAGTKSSVWVRSQDPRPVRRFPQRASFRVRDSSTPTATRI